MQNPTLFQGLNQIRIQFGLSFTERKDLERSCHAFLAGDKTGDTCRAIADRRRKNGKPELNEIELAYYVAALLLDAQKPSAVTHA